MFNNHPAANHNNRGQTMQELQNKAKNLGTHVPNAS